MNPNSLPPRAHSELKEAKASSRRIPSPLSIVICAFNGLGYTKLLVESLRRYSVFEHEIVIWSDGSTDGTAEWLANESGIVWKHDPENRGICTAMNRAAGLATRPYLFFPNTDHVLAPGWDEALLRRLGPRTVVSLSCIEPGIVPVASIFHTVNLGARWQDFDWVGFEDSSRRLAKAEATPGVNYPFALAKTLWQEVGALDERFNPGPANDPDLFYRLHLAGAEMVRAEDCLAYHFSGKSSRMADEATRERREWREVTDRNEKRFEEKWGERYRYANGGLPEPGSEAKRRWFVGEIRQKVEPSDSRLRVAFDARLVGEQKDGIAAYIVGLLRALARRESEIDLHVLSNDPRVLAQKIGPLRGMKCRIVRSRPGDSAAEESELRRVLSDLRPDVFHGPSFSLPRGLDCPGVVTVHDVAFEIHPEWYPRAFAENLGLELRRSLSCAARVIAVSGCTRRDLVEKLRVPPEAIQVVALGPGESTAHRRSGDLSEIPRGPFHDGAPYLIALGMRQVRKNAALLLRAFTQLFRSERTRGAGLLMTLAAQSEDPNFQAEIRSLDPRVDVCVTGHLADEEVARGIAGAAALVYPSSYEGFGLPLLEAMQSGVPVVSSDGGALPEVAEGAALVVPAGDESALREALARILADSHLRKDLALRGISRALGYSWDLAAQQTLEVYRAAMTQPASKPDPRVAASVASSSAAEPRLTLKPKSRGRGCVRVAVDARLAATTHMGTGRYTLEVLKRLGHVAEDAEFVLIGPRTAEELGLPQNLRVVQHVSAGPETLLNPAWEQFGAVAAHAGCDVLYSPTGILPAARTCPGVAVIHDLAFLDRPNDFETRLREHLARWVRRTCLSAERLIAVSAFTKSRILHHFGISPQKIEVVHHGSPIRASSERVPVEPPIILCVSSFEPNKNQSLLLDAFRLAGLEKSARLVLAGRDGRNLAALRARVQASQLEDVVRFEVGVSDDRMRQLHREATVFAFPSSYEGFGLPLVEAMSAGLPVVASSIPACEEVLDEAGIVLPAGDAEAWGRTLGAILADPTRLKELAVRSSARAVQFDWETSAASTWKSIERAIS